MGLKHSIANGQVRNEQLALGVYVKNLKIRLFNSKGGGGIKPFEKTNWFLDKKLNKALRRQGREIVVYNKYTRRIKGTHSFIWQKNR